MTERSPEGKAGPVSETSPVAQGGGDPRQFSIATLLAITTLYALLFGLLRSGGAPPLIWLEASLFLATVGLAQRFMYNGERPGRASAMAGALFFVAIYICAYAVTGNPHPPSAPFDPVEAAMFGAVWGYLFGQVISGVFFIFRSLAGQNVIEGGKESLKESSGKEVSDTE